MLMLTMAILNLLSVVALAAGLSNASLDFPHSTHEHSSSHGLSPRRARCVDGTFSPGEGYRANPSYPCNATNLVELCSVTVSFTNGTSNFNFGLFLPTEWNLRFLAVGNYAFGGGINWADMGIGAGYGMAVVSTDTGHISNGSDMSWAVDSSTARHDWGYMAMHESVRTAKLLTEQYYTDRPINHSYFSGCSTGGRQGLREIQYDVETFDGAIIGAPAWWTTHLMMWITKVARNNTYASANNTDPPTLIIEPAKFNLIAATVYDQCDMVGSDTLPDGIIQYPDHCEPDFAVIACEPGQTTACLDDDEMKILSAAYKEYRVGDPDGTFVYPGFTPGAELSWLGSGYWIDPYRFPSSYERTFLYDDWPSWNLTLFTEQTVYDSFANDTALANADQLDISAFRDRQGKILMYQGLADATIIPGSSRYYYEQTNTAMGGDVRDFFRYFEIPGMSHCWYVPGTGTPNAPWQIAGAGQGAISRGEYENADHDILLALIRWVEGETAPDRLIATAYNVTTTGVIQYAVYNSTGDPMEQENWHCGLVE
ncbi:tannase and feruloyl esterase [Xylariomycetidae sp. FL2044]|nr:tannase and feruloyl esterase [Xylariomycetidae sp. FL2044]